MSALYSTYSLLGIAIVSEVIGSALLKYSQGFSKLWPSLGVVVCYALAFYLLALTLRVMPLGVAYAIWSGLGIVLTGLIGYAVFRQVLDTGALVGMAMIVGGVLVMNLFSNTAAH